MTDVTFNFSLVRCSPIINENTLEILYVDDNYKIADTEKLQAKDILELFKNLSLEYPDKKCGCEAHLYIANPIEPDNIPEKLSDYKDLEKIY